MVGQIWFQSGQLDQQLTSPKVSNFEDGEKPKLCYQKNNLLHEGRRASQSMHLRFVKVKILVSENPVLFEAQLACPCKTGPDL